MPSFVQSYPPPTRPPTRPPNKPPRGAAFAYFLSLIAIGYLLARILPALLWGAD